MQFATYFTKTLLVRCRQVVAYSRRKVWAFCGFHGPAAQILWRYDVQAVLEVGGEESLGAGAGACTEAAQGGLEATPAPWLDALVDRVRNLCIVCGEGTSFVLHVGGEGRLSQVLRPND